MAYGLAGETPGISTLDLGDTLQAAVISPVPLRLEFGEKQLGLTVPEGRRLHYVHPDHPIGRRVAIAQIIHNLDVVNSVMNLPEVDRISDLNETLAVAPQYARVSERVGQVVPPTTAMALARVVHIEPPVNPDSTVPIITLEGANGALGQLTQGTDVFSERVIVNF